ncbi:hypothetical protein MTO96_024717 [Rhipicephalus appendiculatus]
MKLSANLSVTAGAHIEGFVDLGSFTPETQKHAVSLRPVREALKLDGSNVTLQAVPAITASHTDPNNFEKMRTGYAFQLFGDIVLNGLRLYKADIEARCGSIEPLLVFFG